MATECKGATPAKRKHLKRGAWHLVKAVCCDSCKQTTHDVDKDADDCAPFYLGWTKSDTDIKGKKKPTGRECYKCFSTRRKWYKDKAGKIMSLESLNALRKDTLKDDEFNGRRVQEVRGDGRYIRSAGSSTDCAEGVLVNVF